jgi:hypothetical protein
MGLIKYKGTICTKIGMINVYTPKELCIILEGAAQLKVHLLNKNPTI